MRHQEQIHQILLKAVTEVRDVLLETSNSIEIAKLINIHNIIPESQEHDELEEEAIISWS